MLEEVSDTEIVTQFLILRVSSELAWEEITKVDEMLNPQPTITLFRIKLLKCENSDLP